VLGRGEVWRLLTAFLYFGPLDISFGLTMQFVWQYMSMLEKVHHGDPANFVVMWLFGAASLLLAFAAIPSMPSANLGHNLSCFLVYVWARTYEGHEVRVCRRASHLACAVRATTACFVVRERGARTLHRASVASQGGICSTGSRERLCETAALPPT